MNEDHPLNADISGTDDSIHFEKGSVMDETGTARRFANHLFLGELFPDFIPNVVVPKDETLAEMKEHGLFPIPVMEDQPWEKQIEDFEAFPVQAIKGKNWAELLQEKSVTSKQHCHIGQEVIRQMQMVWKRTGVVFNDRNLTNIVIDTSGKVWQVDLDVVFDVFVGDRYGTIDHTVGPDQRSTELVKNYPAYEKIVRPMIFGDVMEILNSVWFAVSSRSVTMEHGDKLEAALVCQKIKMTIDNIDNGFVDGTITVDDIFSKALEVLEY